MKKTMKAVIAAAFMAVFAVNAHALDFGGLFKNNTKFTTPNFQGMGINQQDSLVGWFKAPITADEKIYFSLEADATFRYSTPMMGSNPGRAEFLLNLSLCKFTMFTNIWNGILQLNVGRFATNDATNMVISQTSDGAQLTFTSNYFKAIAYAGYTGLTNSRYDTIIPGAASTFVQDSSMIYQFNSPYILTGLSFSLPYLFANQTIGLEAFAAFGLPGITGSNWGDNRVYITALMNGPIVQNLYYALTTTFGIYEGKASNLSKFSLTYYPPALDSSLSAELLYASGNNGFLAPFTGFTSQSAYLAYGGAAEYTGILKAGASGTIRPLDKLFLSLGADAVFACLNNFSFSGFQWYTQMQFQLYTDLKLGLNAYQFISPDTSKNNLSFALNVTFAF